MNLNAFASSPLRLEKSTVSRLLEGQISIAMRRDVLLQNVLVHILQYHSMVTHNRWRCSAINSEVKFAVIHRTTGSTGFWIWDEAEAKFVRISDTWDSMTLIDYTIKYFQIPEVLLSEVADQDKKLVKVSAKGPAIDTWHRHFFKPHAVTGIVVASKAVIDALDRWEGPGYFLTVNVDKWAEQRGEGSQSQAS